MFGKLFFGFLIVVAVIAVIGFIQLRLGKRKGTEDQQKSVTDNVADLNDRFNRARTMDRDN